MVIIHPSLALSTGRSGERRPALGHDAQSANTSLSPLACLLRFVTTPHDLLATSPIQRFLICSSLTCFPRTVPTLLCPTLLYSNRAFQSPDISSHPSHSNSLQASQTTNHHHHLRHSSSGDPLPTFHCFPFATLFVWSIKLALKQVSSGLGHFSFNQHRCTIHHLHCSGFQFQGSLLISCTRATPSLSCFEVRVVGFGATRVF